MGCCIKKVGKRKQGEVYGAKKEEKILKGGNRKV
jgi:hypothetical protein